MIESQFQDRTQQIKKIELGKTIVLLHDYRSKLESIFATTSTNIQHLSSSLLSTDQPLKARIFTIINHFLYLFYMDQHHD